MISGPPLRVSGRQRDDRGDAAGEQFARTIALFQLSGMPGLNNGDRAIRREAAPLECFRQPLTNRR